MPVRVEGRATRVQDIEEDVVISVYLRLIRISQVHNLPHGKGNEPASIGGVYIGLDVYGQRGHRALLILGRWAMREP